MDVGDLDLPELPAEEQPFVASPVAPAGGFTNPWPAQVPPRTADLLRWQAGRKPFKAAKRRPPRLPCAPDPAAAWQALPGGARVQWLGHASILVEVDGTTVLVDPLFGRAALAPRAAPAPLRPEELPPVDAVLLTHGHYDHTDSGSLRSLVARFGPDLPFLVPAGLGRSLPSACRRVVELSWWQQVGVGGVACTLVPAQHWHRRGPLDANKALWGGWVVAGSRSLYHSGDTGAFGGFRTIGRVFPKLDVAVLPLGAYEPRWFMGPQHMAPEESVQAFLDLGAQLFLGMHWGTFDLTDEPLEHGAFELLPRIVAERELDPARLHVLAHGGALSFADRVRVRSPAGVPGLG